MRIEERQALEAEKEAMWDRGFWFGVKFMAVMGVIVMAIFAVIERVILK